jgi:hypothetical protein
MFGLIFQEEGERLLLMKHFASGSVSGAIEGNVMEIAVRLPCPICRHPLK